MLSQNPSSVWKNTIFKGPYQKRWHSDLEYEYDWFVVNKKIKSSVHKRWERPSVEGKYNF